jgi:hypothetical protein
MHKAFFGDVHWGNVERISTNGPPISLVELGRAHWSRFHATVWTPEELADWERDIPSFSCDCGDEYAKLKEANRVRFDDMARWKWEIHNAVNLRLGKELLGFLDAMSERDRGSNATDGFVEMLQPRILQEIAVPVSSRALITVAPDKKSQAELEITGDRMRAYARNHGLDFVAITSLSKQRYLAANKYAYAEVASGYEQSLWLDTDVVVDPDAPSIFDCVPVGSWGMVDDLVFMDETKWFREEWRRMQSAWGVPSTPVPKAWNSGVVVAPRDAARCYYPSPMRVPNVWCAEQHWHTQCILASSAAIVDLPVEWNNGYPWRDWPKQLATSWFNHVNGCRPQTLRLALLKHLADGNTDIPNELVPMGGDAWQPAWALRAV